MSLPGASRAQARTWTDKSGTYSVQAEFGGLSDGQVSLTREDGRKIVVPLDKLSSADQEYVRQKAAVDRPSSPFVVSEDVASARVTPNDAVGGEDGEQEDAGTLRQVIATGRGATEDEAKRDAFHNAVEHTVGVYVDATTIASNERLIEDTVLTHSNAYIKAFTVLRMSSGEGIHTVKIKALVKVQQLTERLRSQGIKTVTVDGQSLAAEIVTRKRMEDDARAVLASAIRDYPLSFTEFTPAARFAPSSKGGINACVRYSVNKEAYRQYVAELENVLKLQATQSGSAVLPLEQDMEAKLYYSSLPDTVQQLLRHHMFDDQPSDPPGNSFFILGKSIIQREWFRGTHQVVVSWYFLEGPAASVPYEAWSRARDTRLLCSLKDDKGQTLAEIPEQPYRWPRRYDGEIVLMPGGPLGTSMSDLGLELQSFDGRYKYPQVMVYLPALLVPRDLMDKGSPLCLRESVDIPLHFDLPVEDIAKIRNLTVAIEMPQDKRHEK